MTIPEMRDILGRLTTCREWSLHMIKFRKISGNFACNVCDVTITTPNALNKYIESLSQTYVGDKKKIDSYQSIVEYDGSAEATLIYSIPLTNMLVAEVYNKWTIALNNPDHGVDPLSFDASGYAMKGSLIEEDGTDSSVLLFTIISPLRSFKHNFAWTRDSFHAVPDKLLSLRMSFDVLIYRGNAYLFNMNGEKMFDMERAYTQISNTRIEEVIASNFITNGETFKAYASSGHNPRRFVSFKEERFTRVNTDVGFRRAIAEKFRIICDGQGLYDTADKKNVEKIVKFLCGKGMIDPVDDSPVEVDASRRWGI